MSEETRAIELLEELFMVYAKRDSPEAEKEARVIINNMRSYKVRSNYERALAGLIYDGIAYGNWPWIKLPGADT